MYEDDLEYASRRLNNTLVRTHTGKPFFVLRTYYNDAGVMVHDGDVIDEGDRITVRHSELDLEPVPLGFINVTNDMVFVSRKPMRRDWKQGLSHNSIATFGRLRPDEVNIRALSQPINKSYPTFAKALSSLNKRNSMAFSRDFGLTKHDGQVVLVYRKHNVGRVVDGVPVLNDNKQFLQQHLQEAM